MTDYMGPLGGAGVPAAASGRSTGVAASALVAFLVLSLLIVFFVAMMHLPRARFVIAGRRTNCAAPAGSVTYLAGVETSRQFTAEF
jgi:hypothetical protein